MMAEVSDTMYLVVSRCILMYMNGTLRNTCKIHARYMRDTWDTYCIGKNTKTYRKPHVTPGTTYLACAAGRATAVQTARVTRGGFAKEVRRRRRADSPVGKTGRSGFASRL